MPSHLSPSPVAQPPQRMCAAHFPSLLLMYVMRLVVVMSDGLSCPLTFSPLLPVETSCVHFAKPFTRTFVAYCLLWCILFVSAQPSHGMSAAYAFSGVSKSSLHKGRTNGRRKSIYKTRSMKRESTGGWMHMVSEIRIPFLAKVIERAVYANPRFSRRGISVLL